MPVDLPPKFSPRPDVTQKISDRIRQAQFGDGYDQSSPDGINTLQSEYNLSFGDLCYDDVIELLTFFNNLRGIEAVRWKPFDSAAVQLWQVGQRTVNWKTDAIATISCTFTRVYR